jgi:hypothetical protein
MFGQFLICYPFFRVYSSAAEDTSVSLRHSLDVKTSIFPHTYVPLFSPRLSCIPNTKTHEKNKKRTTFTDYAVKFSQMSLYSFVAAARVLCFLRSALPDLHFRRHYIELFSLSSNKSYTYILRKYNLYSHFSPICYICQIIFTTS